MGRRSVELNEDGVVFLLFSWEGSVSEAVGVLGNRSRKREGEKGSRVRGGGGGTRKQEDASVRWKRLGGGWSGGGMEATPLSLPAEQTQAISSRR